MSFDETTVFVTKSSRLSKFAFDHHPGQAYDLDRDVDRYHELRSSYSDAESRRILLQEMTTDLMTHFAELNRVGGFSYRYRIAEGTLVEDSDAAKPIIDMFQNQEGVVAKLWQEHLIPTLESMPVDSIVFTYSARQNGGFEGGYDYAYIFQKIDENTIHCNGLELVLTRSEQAAILNEIYRETNKFHLLLTDNPDGDDVRSRAFYFPPGKFDSITEAYSQLIGQVIKPLRSKWSLETSADYEAYLKNQETQMLLQRQRSQELAQSIIDDLDFVPLAIQKQKLATEQQKDLWRMYPQLMTQAVIEGFDQVLLPCGFVDIGSDLGINIGDMRFTAGAGLVETSSWSYHTGTCRHCHASPTEVGPCEICRHCEKIL